ncbi:hypothetical protein ABPG75_012526 [Micractinium tetrahymenae]
MEPEAGAAHIACLPDDLLSRIFGHLPFNERHQAVPLVCRRWAQAVVSPHLLRHIAFDSATGPRAPPGPSVAQRARSFCAWLGAHAAGHVQDLELCISTAHHEDSDDSTSSSFPEVVAMLTACAAGGSLQRLHLHLQSVPGLRLPASLAAALSSLHSLSVEIDEGGFTLDVPLAAWSCLRELRVAAHTTWEGGWRLVLTPAATLPPSLTKLHLCGIGWGLSESRALPLQIVGLTCLRELSLEGTENGQASYAALNALGGCLERLRLGLCSWLPPPSTFAALSRLTMLSVDTLGEEREIRDEFEGDVEPVLRVLPQLRHLRLSYASSAYGISLPRMPRVLADLHRLTGLWWDLDIDDRALPDPSGPWLRSLRRLALPDTVLACNESVLEAASCQLESLYMLGTDNLYFGRRVPSTLLALELAVRHTTLSLVHIEGVDVLPVAKPALQAAGQGHRNVQFESSKLPLFKVGAAFDDAACRG